MPGRKRPAQVQQADEEPDGSQIDISDTSDDGSGDDSFPDVSDEEGSQQDASSDEEEQYMEDDAEEVKEITVEFEFFSPEEKDFLGLKALLSNYLSGEQFDSSGFIDAIIAQGEMAGTVVKTDEDDDPIAIMTVLNLQQHKEAAFMKQIHEFIKTKCPAGKTVNGTPLRERLNEVLQSEGTGLLVNERLLNSPPKLGPPLLQFIMQEVKEQASSGEPHAQFFQYQRYFLATRVYRDVNASNSGTTNDAHSNGGSESRPSKKIKTNQAIADGSQQQQPQQQQIVYIRPEDEYLHQHCEWSFVVPIEDRPVTKDGLQAARLVMQVDADKVPLAQAELDRVVGNMAAGYTGEQSDDEDEDEEAGPSTSSGKKGTTSLADVQRMANEAFAAAAAAGAGRGAQGGGGGGKKKKDKKKGAGFSAKATTL